MIAALHWLSPRLNHSALTEKKIMSARTNRWVIAAAIAALILGAILSRVIEPGVRVEKIMLTTNTPALRIFPATPGPHPIALLAHGNGGSKEMSFVSARRSPPLVLIAIPWIRRDMENRRNLAPSPTSGSISWRPERALGEVDVFIGHSMGGGAGAWSVREAGFRPKLFIGVGNPATLGEHGPPLLLLVGRFEEFIDQPSYEHKRMRRSSFLPGPTTSSKPSIQCS